jgi:DNA polymerase-3 subunit gamma/tau
MAYTVFARKYRPQTFADVAGQEAIAKTLRNAVVQGRVAHAYLFAGPRGVGKTSMARILAKALNCATPRDGEPCNECPSCVDITAGRHFDVDEFDAASNRKVEDAEALIQRVPQRAMRADTKFRVFIVDEVHMMTTHAFNALLKTLEEPPPHVKFIFATTEPEELPDTILSRCQRFDFKRVGRDAVVMRLRLICEREKIEASDAALRLLVKRARGGMRDAQMLLDQAVALCGTSIDERALKEALGIAPRERVQALVAAVAAGDVPGVLDAIEAAYGDGVDASELCAQLLELARDLMALAACGRAAAEKVLDEPDAADELAPLAEKLGVERAIHILGQVAELERQIQAARDDRVLVELALVKLAKMADVVSLAEALERLRRMEGGGGSSTSTSTSTRAGASPKPPEVTAPPPKPAAPVAPPAKPGFGRPPPGSSPTPAPFPAARAAAPPAAPAPRPAPPPPPPSAPTGPLSVDAYRRACEILAENDSPLIKLLPELDAVSIDRGALVLPFANDFDRGRIMASAANREALERALEAAGAPRGPLKGVLAAGGKAATAGAAPARRRAHRDVAEDPDVRKVIRHTGGELVDFVERAPVDDHEERQEGGV